MAISVNHATRVIYVPQSFLNPLGGSIYELNVNDLRLAIKDLEDDEDGIVLPTVVSHNTQVTLAGITFARTVEFINGYVIEFEDGQYAVQLTGANNNIADVMVVNQVSLRSANSAGLIVTGAGDPNEVADAVLARTVEGTLTMQQVLRLMGATLFNKLSGAETTTVHIRDRADTKDRIVATVDANGNRSAVTIDPS